MRYAVLIALGLAIGIIGTVMAMNALNSGPHLPQSVMALQGFHMHALDTNIKQNHCAVTDNLPHLQTLRALSNDVEPAFLPIENEQDFRQKASNLRASIDAVLAAPPADCAAVGAAMTRIGHECKGCHDSFRH
ncbi:MAG TPA: cytochrome c [Xanthomonadaceae bacterium]|nr:cytochrome c [Xanthomonadaceae bacterium]